MNADPAGGCLPRAKTAESTCRSALVVHLLALDARRGAQTQARTLARALDAVDCRSHATMTIFEGPSSSLGAEHRLEVSGRPSGWSPSLRGVAATRRALRRMWPVCVVAHGSEPLKYAVAAGFGGRTVYHRIGVGTVQLEHGWRRVVHQFVVRRAAAHVAVSSDAARDLERFAAAHVTVIPNLRNPSEFPPRQPHAGPLRLLFLGALTRTKHPERFLEAVEQLRAHGRDVAATVVGDGPMLAELRTRAAGRDVDVVGPTADPAAVLQSHDVLVFPSEREGEGMPGVLIEAGLSGLAVVATDVPGVRDVIVDGQTGLVVPGTRELVQALERLTDEPALVDRLGAAARDRCAERFSASSVVPAWLRVLDGVARS